MTPHAMITTGFVGDLGLTLDISGAFFLAVSFLLKKREAMLKESGDYLDGNPYRLTSAVRQRLEAQVGFCFLFAGFMGQFIADTKWVTVGADKYPIAVVGLGVIVLATAFVLVNLAGSTLARRRLATEWGDAMLRSLASTKPEKVHSVSLFYGDAFDMRPLAGETADAFRARLEKAIGDWRRPKS